MLSQLLKNKFLILFIVSIFLIFLTIAGVLIKEQKEKLAVYAIKYGDSFYHSRNIYYQDNLNKLLPFAWMFYVIKYNNKILLIDTGFRKKKFIEAFKIDYQDPIELLGQLNIKPEMVTDVILTHSHFDHIGNVDKFKNAKIYLQREEFEYFKKNSKNQEILNFLKNNQKLILFNDYYNLDNFLKIEKIGGHTIGSSIVSFNYKKKQYIITGDECYFLDNCEGKPIGTFYNIKKNKEFIKKLKAIRNKIILPFHDYLIFKNYPQIKKSIAKIIFNKTSSKNA